MRVQCANHFLAKVFSFLCCLFATAYRTDITSADVFWFWVLWHILPFESVIIFKIWAIDTEFIKHSNIWTIFFSAFRRNIGVLVNALVINSKVIWFVCVQSWAIFDSFVQGLLTIWKGLGGIFVWSAWSVHSFQCIRYCHCWND